MADLHHAAVAVVGDQAAAVEVVFLVAEGALEVEVVAVGGKYFSRR